MNGIVIGRSEPLEVRASYQPLSASFEMKQMGGTLEQWYYSNTGDYEPTRSSSSPLTLVPTVILTDPETHRVYTPALGTTWKIDGASPATVDGADVKYLARADGSLVVRDNILPGTGRGKLECIITWADPVTETPQKKIWHGELVTHQKSDTVYDIRIISSNNQTWDPLSGTSSQKTFKAQVKTGNIDMGSSVKWFWYWLDGNTERLITTFAGYVSGQNTDTLVVDADYASSLRIFVRVSADNTAASPDQPGRAWCQLEWQLPKIKSEGTSPNSLVKKSSEKTKQMDVQVTAGQGLLSDAILKERLACHWMKVKAGAADAHVAWGHSIEADVSDVTVGNEYGLRPDLFLMGPLEAVNGVISGQAADSTPAGLLVGQSCTGVISGEASGDTLAGQPCYGRQI